MATMSHSTVPIGMLRNRRSLLLGGLGLAGTAAVLQHYHPEAAPSNPLAGARVQLAHLLRRAGFGATGSELDQFEAMGYEATVSWLLDYANVPDPIDDRLDALALDLTKPDDLKRWWLLRMRYTTRPLQERMTLFLHGLLTSALSKSGGRPYLLKQQNDLFRNSATGSYRDLLVAVSRDPAMLLWLDGNGSRKQHPNENYARELMELFTIGVGNYTEDDVRESARAFTGWSVPRDATEAVYNPRTHDDGLKTFLGQTGRFGPEDIIDIILQQPAAGRFLARKLWTFFAYPNPEPAVLDSLAAVLQNSGYNLGEAVRWIFLSDAFRSARAYRAIIKSPVDLVIGTLRTLGLETDAKGLPGLLLRMGQDIFNPPNVAGWPGGPAWINSATWLQRVNFANSIAINRRGPDGTFVDLARLIDEQDLQDTGGFRSYLTGLLLDGQLDDDRRNTLDAYLAAGEEFELTPASLNRKGRGLLYLTLACPEYHLL